MYNIKLAGLDTGKTYYVKVRAKVFGYETSEWSLPFKFATPMDTMPPGRPEEVSFVSEGDSFIAKWNAPQYNEDGTPCGDISHYKLVFTDLDNDIVRVERSIDTTFTMDYNRNVQIFGKAAGKIEMTVSAVDLSSNEGKGVTAIAQNPPPGKIKNLAAEPGMESVNLTWTESEDADLVNYQIHVSTDQNFELSGETLRALAAPGTNSFTYETTSLQTLYFKVVSADKFNQTSPESDEVSARPKLSTDVDNTPPESVDGMTVVQELAENNATAVAIVSYVAGSESDLEKYEIQYRKTGDIASPWSFATIPSDEDSAEIKPLPLGTDYDFRIRAVDSSGNKSPWSATVVAEGVKKTTLPPAPTEITVRGGLTNIMVTWTGSDDPTMANWAGTYEVQIDETIGFTSPIVINTTGTLASFTNLSPDTNYYVRIRSIDPYENVGEWSNAVVENTGNVVTDSSNIYWSHTEPEEGKENDLWIKLPENTQYRYDGSNWVKAQDSELIDSLGTKSRNIYSDEDAAGTSLNGIPFLNGDTWYKRNSSNAIVKMWEFFEGEWIVKEISNLAPDSVTTTALAADSVTAGKIKFGEISGNHLEANAAVVNNLKVRSSIEIDDAGGHIKSSNFNDSDETGFYMDDQQLIIHDGKVSAAALDVQDSNNLLPPHIAAFNHPVSFYEDLVSENGAEWTVLPPFSLMKNGILMHTRENTIITMARITPEQNEGQGLAPDTYINTPTGKYIFSAHVYGPPGARVAVGVMHITIGGGPSGEVWSEEYTLSGMTGRPQVLFETESNLSTSIPMVRFISGTDSSPEVGWHDLQLERVMAGRETASPWTSPGYTTIQGESITTGEIRSNVPAATNPDIPAWSINTYGNARLNDAVVGGRLIVGGYDSEGNNEGTSVQSSSYDPGIEGWAIKGNGDVEFNNGTFRGVLNLSSPGAGESAPTLTASVRPTDLYVTPAEKKMIHIAGIRGQVTGYTREEVDEDSGQYLPTTPDPNKRARYFIGPTTDRSLTIQVHDSSDIGDVAFLDNAPDDVNLSLINIGEITHPSEEPSGYLAQGFRHRSGSGDSANYARVEQASTATTGSPEDMRASHSFSIDSRSDLHKRTSQASLALNSDPAESNAASMNLSVTEFHESAGGIVSDSAEYVWSPQGVSYPGTATPFMPTAASISWDWRALPTANRPHVGGNSIVRVINTGSWGRINTGDGRSYEDKFNGPEERPLRGSWISYGNPKAFKKDGQVRWASSEDWAVGGIHSNYYIHSSPLGSPNQDVAGQYDFWYKLYGLGGGYFASGTVICSYDPVTRDGIFFRYRDNGTALSAEIFVRNNGQERRIWYTNAHQRYTSYEQRLVRDGNVIRAYLAGNLVATVTNSNLPSGEHFGFSLYSGRLKEVRGKALTVGSDAHGILMPTSININNGRGITINTNGTIHIDTPGYYMISVVVEANKFGGHWDREYWMMIRHSGGEHQIGNNGSRYDGNGFGHMQGSLVAHMSGPVQFVVNSNHISHESKMLRARIDIARVA